MSARPLPSYLRVVPPSGKRFRRPRKARALDPLPRDGEVVARVIQQAERVEAIVRRLHEAVFAQDHIVVRALSDRADIETRFLAGVIRGLREGTTCA